MADVIREYQWSQLKYVGYVNIWNVNWPVYELEGYNTYAELNEYFNVNKDHHYIKFPAGEHDVSIIHGIYRQIAADTLRIIGSGGKEIPDAFTIDPCEFTYSKLSYGSYGYGHGKVKRTGLNLTYKTSTYNIASSVGLEYGSCPTDTYMTFFRYKTSDGKYNIFAGGFLFYIYLAPGLDKNNYKSTIDFNPFNGCAFWPNSISTSSSIKDVEYGGGTIHEGLPPDEIEPDPPPEPDPPEGDIDTGTKLPGGYDPDSDEIPDGLDNWLSASALGMCTVYNPTQSQVRDLATRLFSKDFQSGFENFIWGNPIESIIGLSVFPCPIPDGGTATVKSWGLDTGVTMTLAGSTMVHVNCGSLPVPNVYEGYLDYSPYTQAEIYIPYVGFVGLDADDIMGQNLQLHYYIDIISGSATAKLVISNTSTTTVLGQWACQVGRQIPIGAKDYNDIINAGVQLVTAAVGAYSGSVIPEIVTDLGDALQYEGGGFNGTKFATQMLRAGSSAIMQAKPNITRGSAIASASGQLAVQTPYLILKRPVSAKTNGYGALVGYPTFKYGNIGSYAGFVRCHNIKLDGIGCTDWELSEIFRLCCEGVYI